MVKHVYNVDLKIDSFSLLKIQEEKNIDDILTIAFWSIYKMIVLRNETGKDERSKRLWYMFLKEIKIRLEINNIFVKMGRKKIIQVTWWPELVLDIVIVTYVWKWLSFIVDLIELFLREINIPV